jgi:GDPmannose 4,6-dehydratase
MQWRMLQQEGPPEDFVIATGRQESLRRFIELAALELGWGAISWRGEVVVRIGPRYFRPAEVETLLRLKGFKVVGSMENPPTNPQAVEQASGGRS